jgi:hypothetical protein
MKKMVPIPVAEIEIARATVDSFSFFFLARMASITAGMPQRKPKMKLKIKVASDNPPRTMAIIESVF